MLTQRKRDRRGRYQRGGLADASYAQLVQGAGQVAVEKARQAAQAARRGAEWLAPRVQAGTRQAVEWGAPRVENVARSIPTEVWFLIGALGGGAFIAWLYERNRA